MDRRGLLGAGISLAAAVQLRSASPADALVVSKEWEKVTCVLCHSPQYALVFIPDLRIQSPVGGSAS